MARDVDVAAGLEQIGHRAVEDDRDDRARAVDVVQLELQAGGVCESVPATTEVTLPVSETVPVWPARLLGSSSGVEPLIAV